MGAHLVMLAVEGGYQSSDDSFPGWFFGGFMVLWAVLMLVSLAGYVFGIWSLVEIIRYREDEFASVGLNRTTWLVLQIVGLVVCQPLGAVVGIWFLWKQRPLLRAWREAHPGAPVVYVPYMAYGPPPGYPPPPAYPSAPGQAPAPGFGPAPAQPPEPASPPPPPPGPQPDAADGAPDEGR